MTPAAITQYRLANQHLTQADFTRPQQVVDWLVASQAQDYAGAKWALGLRMAGATDALLDKAFNDGDILRTHVLRPTWHFVTPADIRWLLTLTAPRVHQVNGTMYRQAGLDEAIFSQSAKVITRALQDGQQLTRDELRDRLQQDGIDTSVAFRVTYIMMWAELERIICSGPRQGKQFTYMLLEERVVAAAPLTRADSLAKLAGRYFKSRGPATAADFARWSGLTLTEAREGVEAVRHELVQDKINGETYWRPQTPIFSTLPSPKAFLLSIYDEYISSYKDRSAMGEAEVGEKLMALGNALTYIIVLDGQIVGTFRRELKRKSVIVELNPFRPLTGAEEEAVSAAAHQFATFLNLSLDLKYTNITT